MIHCSLILLFGFGLVGEQSDEVILAVLPILIERHPVTKVGRLLRALFVCHSFAAAPGAHLAHAPAGPAPSRGAAAAEPVVCCGTFVTEPLCILVRLWQERLRSKGSAKCSVAKVP